MPDFVWIEIIRADRKGPLENSPRELSDEWFKWITLLDENRISVIVKEFLLGTLRSVEFVGDGILLGENGMEMTDGWIGCQRRSIRENSFRKRGWRSRKRRNSKEKEEISLLSLGRAGEAGGGEGGRGNASSTIPISENSQSTPGTFDPEVSALHGRLGF